MKKVDKRLRPRSIKGARLRKNLYPFEVSRKLGIGVIEYMSLEEDNTLLKLYPLTFLTNLMNLLTLEPTELIDMMKLFR